MPRRKRGSRGPKKPNQVWLGLRVEEGPPTRTRGQQRRVLLTLLESIERGDYELPDGWVVTIRWRNRKDAPMKEGEWQEELIASRTGWGGGFDALVSTWLRGLIRAIDKRE